MSRRRRLPLQGQPDSPTASVAELPTSTATMTRPGGDPAAAEDRKDVEALVRGCLRDLDCVAAPALPEMLFRLARQRLSTTSGTP